MNPNKINNLIPTDTPNQTKNLEITTTDFLIGSLSVLIFLIATYQLASVMYPDLLPMPQYVSLQHLQMVEYKRELLKQSGAYYTLSMIYLVFLYLIRKIRAKA